MKPSRCPSSKTVTVCKCGCGQQCLRDYVRGHNRSNWKGGKTHCCSPYTLVWAPGHPRAQRGYVAEHILVAEKALGRHLPLGHPVHHWDEDKRNNSPKNLLICEDHSYHMLIHARMRAAGFNVSEEEEVLWDEYLKTLGSFHR